MEYRSIFCFLALCLLLSAGNGQELLEAQFHMLGVTGSANLTWSANTLNVTISLSTAMNETKVEIHPIWMNYDVQDKCGDSQLGDPEPGLTTNVNIPVSPVSVQFSNVSSLASVEGHSLVLKGPTFSVCATIHQKGEHTTAKAHFVGIVSGMVYFRQFSASSAVTLVTRIVGQLDTVVDLSKAEWVISDGSTNCSSMTSRSNATIYNPKSGVVDSGCTPKTQSSCAVGYLKGKLGPPSLASGKNFSFSDTNLPLVDASGIVEKLLIIYNSDSSAILGCANIKLLTAKRAFVKFSHQGVKGSLTFSQRSPFDPTQTAVNLTGLNGMAKGYHVHLWPTPFQVTAGQDLCGAIVVSGHFNPYGKITSSAQYPAPDVSTDDMYEVGDLSAKYGTLENALEKSSVYTDWNLPLFGENSIIGRSVVIHRNDTAASRWVCSNIRPMYPVVTARAVFRYPVIGQIVFMQELNEPLAETSVFAQLDYNDNRAGTVNNTWAINTNPIYDQMLTTDETVRCKSTGPKYMTLENLLKPLNIRNTGGVNGKNAASTNLFTTHTIRSRFTSNAVSFFTVVGLSLSGDKSVVGRPAVIFTPDESKISACAPIEMQRQAILVAEFAKTGVAGNVIFKQMPGFGAQETSVTKALTGIHINTNSISLNFSLQIYDLPPANDCSNLGSVYNPTNVADTTTVDTDDSYKAGDLSRAIGTEWSSVNLPLTGYTSIMGRSLAIVDERKNIVTCAKIETQRSDSDGQRVTAVSNFTGEVFGTIFMSQTVYNDGTMSDTSIVADLKYSNGTKTLHHNWHTHTSPVNGDANALTGRCDSTGPHFDPYHAMIAKDNYPKECNPLNPLRCELGDQAMKAGTYDIGGGRKAFTDVDLPLNGQFSVLGRAVVIHNAEKGAPRLSCADIIPVDDRCITIELKKNATLDKRDVAKVYATAIGSSTEDVIVEHMSDSDSKSKICVHFSGLSGEGMMTKFASFITKSDNYKSLGAYAPFVINTANSNGKSVILGTLILLFHVFNKI
ncbi:unnamed protein product [Lymnaea stagnalis]|uniref:Superoxide dismutase copper/zinc binding domain-containing protein n=1 Tax=Lymnaea stagnalis TaxID=6523 RepID=A0AAV2HKM8_LYMST